ncbi:MAG TPA: hypothetical protein VGB37_05335 [Candidatus Lokiarchaeia archaeon]
MKRTITIIVLSVIIVILLAVIIFGYFGNKKRITNLTLTNDETVKYYTELLEKEKNKKPITIKEIQVMTDKEKEQTIIKLQDEKKGLLDIIQKLNSDLEKTNNELKKQYKLKHSIEAFALAGIDTTLTPDIYIGLAYTRTFYITNKLAFNIGGGVGYKPYKDQGGCLLFELGFKF